MDVNTDSYLKSTKRFIMTEEERKEKATRILRQITAILAEEHVTLFDAKMLFTSAQLAMYNSTEVVVVEHCDWDTLPLPYFNQIESATK